MSHFSKLPKEINPTELIDPMIAFLREQFKDSPDDTATMIIQSAADRFCSDKAAVNAQAVRIRDLVSETELLRNTEKRCFFALALGYFGRGATLDEALINLLKAGCKREAPIAVDLFIGDDKPTVINGGLNIQYNNQAIRIRIGLFKSLGAALRNLREP